MSEQEPSSLELRAAVAAARQHGWNQEDITLAGWIALKCATPRAASTSPAGETARERIAEKIARDLFTNGYGQRAVQLVLVDAGGQNLGGWGEKPLTDRIARALRSTEGGK